MIDQIAMAWFVLGLAYTLVSSGQQAAAKQSPMLCLYLFPN